MARPYNKKTIEDAALLAETMASNPHLGDMQWVALFLGIRESSTAFNLAFEAITAVNLLLCNQRFDYRETCAEAAALIAEGWQIGDEVVLLNHVDVIADENCPQDRAYVINKPGTQEQEVGVLNVFHIGKLTSIDESPLTDEAKTQANTALEAMTTPPVETETPVADVEPVTVEEAPAAPAEFNFYAQDDDGE